MVVRIEFVFLYLIWVFHPNAFLGFLFTDSGIELAHLRSLPHLVVLSCKKLSSLDSTAPCRSPHYQRFKGSIRRPFAEQMCSFLFSMLKQSLGHFLGIVDTLG